MTLGTIHYDTTICKSAISEISTTTYITLVDTIIPNSGTRQLWWRVSHWATLTFEKLCNRSSHYVSAKRKRGKHFITTAPLVHVYESNTRGHVLRSDPMTNPRGFCSLTWACWLHLHLPPRERWTLCKLSSSFSASRMTKLLLMLLVTSWSKITSVCLPLQLLHPVQNISSNSWGSL